MRIPDENGPSYQHNSRRGIMAQRVDSRALFDARPSSGLVVNLLSGATRHGPVGFGAREEPGLWTLHLPIGAQFDQQAFGKQSVAVFVTFALVDADEHAARIALNVLGLEPDNFTDAQAASIRGHE